MLTPEQFKIKMQELDNDYDPELSHCNADDLMCNLLIELGYGEGIKIFENMKKWYA